MVPEIDDGATTAVVDEEPLRPPESWPGAGGLRSVAPEMPSWPTGPLPRATTPPAQATQRAQRPHRSETGDSWPGAASGSATTAVPAPATAGAATAGAATARAEKPPRAARGRQTRGVMWQALVLLAVCVAIGGWVMLDANSRTLQASVLGLALVAGGAVAAVLRRRGPGR